MSTEEASLGLATTQELIAELAARADVAASIGEMWPGYSTVGGYAIEEQVKPAVEEPKEFGSVVRAVYPLSVVLHFCRTYSVDADKPWCSAHHLRSWADVVDGAVEVEVLRVGIGPDPLAQWETQLLSEEACRDAAAAVLSAMDVDQYLIDAVVNARPR